VLEPAGCPRGSVFDTSDDVLFLKYFGVPHERSSATSDRVPETRGRGPLTWIWHEGESGARRRLGWPATHEVGSAPRQLRLGANPLFATVLPDASIRRILEAHGSGWRPVTPIEDLAGKTVASVWRSEGGDVFLPFDPDEVMHTFWSEAYQSACASPLSAKLKAVARGGYYHVKPFLPRRAQIALRRLYSGVQERSTFPRWPVETALHDFYAWFFGLLVDVAGEPVPYIAPWPHDHRWALVLTHDVETSAGYEHLEFVRALELSTDVRSSWNFVPARYAVDQRLVRTLQRDGFEVGVHGLRHDGFDLSSFNRLEERLPAIHEHAERWNAVGFRAPALNRVWDWMPLLGFDYDSSYPDTDPYEPQAGGCCTWLPFPNRDLVELPVTLPQDHTLFVILRQADERLWLEKADFLKSRGGMALIITHPDYMLDDGPMSAYERFLAHCADDAAWNALPCEVSAWWRRRAASHLERRRDGWTVVGPAAGEARVQLATGNGDL
jgi:hypothetical protein